MPNKKSKRNNPKHDPDNIMAGEHPELQALVAAMMREKGGDEVVLKLSRVIYEKDKNKWWAKINNPVNKN